MATLLQRFLKTPKQTGSIADSSPFLAEAMVKHARLDGDVLELGAGRGPITKAILQTLPPHGKLELVEIDPALVKHLEQLFPQLTTHCCDIEEALAKKPAYTSIISGIPFAVMDREKRRRVFHDIFSRLAPGGTFVMFQYSKTTLNELIALFGREQVRVEFVPLNVPPAFVFTCTKKEGLR